MIGSAGIPHSPGLHKLACTLAPGMAYTLHKAPQRQLDEVTPFLQLSKMPGVTVYGPPPTTEYRHTALVSYNVNGADAMDVCHFLDLHGELSCAHL